MIRSAQGVCLHGDGRQTLCRSLRVIAQSSPHTTLRSEPESAAISKSGSTLLISNLYNYVSIVDAVWLAEHGLPKQDQCTKNVWETSACRSTTASNSAVKLRVGPTRPQPSVGLKARRLNFPSVPKTTDPTDVVERAL